MFYLSTALYTNFQAEYEKYMTNIAALSIEGLQYPQSPGQPGTHTFSTVPLANLGVAPGATSHSGFVVQYGKPREADSIKLLASPKLGMSFEKWLGHALDSIGSSTSYCAGAYRWASKVQTSETTFDELSGSGNFARFDAVLLTALMGCIS